LIKREKRRERERETDRERERERERETERQTDRDRDVRKRHGRLLRNGRGEVAPEAASADGPVRADDAARARQCAAADGGPAGGWRRGHARARRRQRRKRQRRR
jgi:hypothetical protein